MEIGLHLPSAQTGASAEGILEVARAAERLGFDAVWMFDHLFTPVALASRYPYARGGAYPLGPGDPFFDPLALFGVLAGATARVKIGTGVLVAAYRHPIVLGKLLASVEQFAPGRIVLGVGAGWMKEELDAVGVGYERRGARLEEYLRALRAIWSGEPSEFRGEHYAWPRAGFLPAPTRPIPIVVGGHTDPALRRAARHADGWAIATGEGQGAGIAAVEARLQTLRRFRVEAGRADAPFDLVYQNALWFSERANPKLPFTGPPDAIAESLRALAALGVTMVDLVVFGPTTLVTESAARFAEEVRPLL
jgi:probable F420-dependent oxidoreductase